MATQPVGNRYILPKLFTVLQQTLKPLLFSSVDSASLVYFRIAFGVIMLWEVWRYFNHNWIKRYWIDPPKTMNTKNTTELNTQLSQQSVLQHIKLLYLAVF